MLKKYLNNPAKLNQAMLESSPEHHQGFKLFKLQPQEQRISQKIRAPKRPTRHPDDPYFNKYTNNYEKMHTVSSTDNLIDHMHKLDFKKLKNKNMEHVRAKSKELM